MREILFRGKRVDNSEWITGNYMCTHYNNHQGRNGDIEHWIYPLLNDVPPREVISETIGQFTGKLDRNDKQIFEGDVNQDKGVCVWNIDDASFCWDYKVIGLDPMDSEQDWCKVTGNIHDHETA